MLPDGTYPTSPLSYPIPPPLITRYSGFDTYIQITNYNPHHLHPSSPSHPQYHLPPSLGRHMGYWTKRYTYKGWCTVKLMPFSKQIEGCSYRIVGGIFLQLLNALQRKGFRPIPEARYDWQFTDKYFLTWTKDGYEWQYNKTYVQDWYQQWSQIPGKFHISV